MQKMYYNTSSMQKCSCKKKEIDKTDEYTRGIAGTDGRS